MKLVSFYQNGKPTLGILEENGVIPVVTAAEAASLSAPRTMEEAITGGQVALSQLQALLATKPTVLSLDAITYAPCVASPEKILCVGLNYAVKPRGRRQSKSFVYVHTVMRWMPNRREMDTTLSPLARAVRIASSSLAVRGVLARLLGVLTTPSSHSDGTNGVSPTPSFA